MEIVLENSCVFAKAVGLSSGEIPHPTPPPPKGRGMEYNSTFPPNFERRRRFLLINLLWWEMVLPLLPVSPAAVNYLVAGAHTQQTRSQAGNMGRLHLTPPGLHRKGRYATAGRGVSGAVGVKDPERLVPLLTPAPWWARSHRHVPCGRSPLCVRIRLPISPAFRFGSLEAAGRGWVLEDAPYDRGKRQVSGIPARGKRCSPIGSFPGFVST